MTFGNFRCSKSVRVTQSGQPRQPHCSTPIYAATHGCCQLASSEQTEVQRSPATSPFPALALALQSSWQPAPGRSTHTGTEAGQVAQATTQSRAPKKRRGQSGTRRREQMTGKKTARLLNHI